MIITDESADILSWKLSFIAFVVILTQTCGLTRSHAGARHSRVQSPRQGMSDPDARPDLLQQQIDEMKASRQLQLARDAAKAASKAALRSTAAKCAQGLVKLNVGGVKYTTSLTTLVAVPDAYFGCLFSGDWALTKSEDGEMFVDRDGEVSCERQTPPG